MLEIRPSEERGSARLDWLYSRHTFTFGQYYHPQQLGFSDLLVINEDEVQPGQGFATHPHRDMEILSYVLSGALEHRDSMGTGSVIHPGEVQLMSAGTGVTHSEFNASTAQPVHFLQIWLVPNRKGVEPRYQQQCFSETDRRGRFALIVSPDGEENSLFLYQDTRIHAGLFDGSERDAVILPEGRYAYVHVARGSVALNGLRMEAGDGVRVRNEREIVVEHGMAAEVLLFDLRPHELPEA